MLIARAIVLGWLAGALLPAPASAQVYKWVDAEGRVHYGERPPTARDAARLDIPLRGNDPPSKSAECHSIQCQYERLREDRLIREAASQREMESRARVAEAQRNAQPPRSAGPDPLAYEPMFAPIVRRPIWIAPGPRPHPPQRPQQPAEPSVRLRLP